MRFIKSLSVFILLSQLLYGGLAGRAQPAPAEASMARVDSGPKMISVNIAGNVIAGFYWPPGAKIIVTIDDPTIPGTPDFTAVAVWESMWSDYFVRLGDRFTLRPGLTVTMTDGSTTKVLLIKPLEVTNIDRAADTVSGRTAPFAAVQVRIAPDIERTAHPGKDGLWTVDFSTPGSTLSEQQTYDISRGSAGSAEVYDEDFDSIVVNWRDCNLNVQVDEHQVSGFDWFLGEILTLKIDDPHTGDDPDYTASQAVFNGGPENPGQTVIDFRLGAAYDIQPGDEVSLSDGMVTRTLVVTPPGTIHIDVDTNVASGTTLPNQRVFIGGKIGERYAQADNNGRWSADFNARGQAPSAIDSPAEDFKPGAAGSYGESDTDGDRSIYDWQLPDIDPIRVASSRVKFGQSVSASITFNNPDHEVGDTLQWDWGDGTTTEDLHPDMPTVTAAHQYSRPGVYDLTATIRSSSGRVSESEHSYGLIVSGSSAGVALGEGWFNSPGEASPTSPSSGERANFLFVNAFPGFLSAPVGLAMLEVGNITFVSTAYEWLVANGAKLQVKGSGTINGKGSYAFLLIASDGQASDGLDKLRIKIWNTSTGQVVYDNQPGAGDFAAPDTTIGGGFIHIQ
jgi:hypothetical protein